MYTSITELPTQVTASLDDTDAQVWMYTYNSVIPENPTDEQVIAARRRAWESVKTAPSSFSFCIKASVEVVDKDKEIIDVRSIIDHMDSFMKYGGNVQNEHGNYNVATIWGWDPITSNGKPGVQVWGNVFGGDAIYDATREAFLNGKSSLSIGGEADQGVYQCDDKGCYTRRHVTQLLEISLCTVPANKEATMVWYNRNAKLTKSATDSPFTLEVESYEIHKDYTACPIQSLKKSLRDAGYLDVHARSNGCTIAVQPGNLLEDMTDLAAMGYWSRPTEDGLFVRPRETAVKEAYTALRKHGYIDKTGYLTSTVPKDVFTEYLSDGFIVKDDDGFYRLTRFI